jgi:hypothetical protein
LRLPVFHGGNDSHLLAPWTLGQDLAAHGRNAIGTERLGSTLQGMQEVVRGHRV